MMNEESQRLIEKLERMIEELKQRRPDLFSDPRPIITIKVKEGLL